MNSFLLRLSETIIQDASCLRFISVMKRLRLPQVRELEAMMKHMQKVLEEELSGESNEHRTPHKVCTRHPSEPRRTDVMMSELLRSSGSNLTRSN